MMDSETTGAIMHPSPKKKDKEPKKSDLTKPLPKTDTKKKLTVPPEYRDNASIDKHAESRDFLAKAKRLLQQSSDSRKRYDYEWMVRDLYRRGYHFSKYQPTTNTIVLASRQTAKIPINIVKMQMRSICNQVTSFRPKWDVMPKGMSEESKTVARYSQYILDDIFDTQKLKGKIKETVKQGLMFSVGGPWQIVYNEESDQVEIWTMDTFDFYWDMFADSMQECQYMIKAVRRPVDEVQKNPRFSESARSQVVGAEMRLAVSENKQFLVQSMRELPVNKEEDYDSLILFEGYFKQRDDKGKVEIRKLVWTDQNIDPLVDEMTGEDEFDFVLYKADLNPKEILGESWMKDIMPINRVIDSVESSVYDYIKRIAVGRLLVDKDSGVKRISTTHGEIIHKNRGSEVRPLEMQNLPNAVNLFLGRFQKYAEDMGGVHDHTLGRNATGARSGVQLDKLNQSDANSQDDLVDNLEDFLEEVAYKVLKKVARHYKTYHVVRSLGYRDSEVRAFAVVGEKSGKKGNPMYGGKKVKIGSDVFDLAIIGEKNLIRVNITSFLGTTKEAARQTALDLAKAGVIGQEEVLKVFEFGDINEIIQRTRKEALLNKAIASGQPTAPGQPPVDAYSLAETENEMMVYENKDMPVSDMDDHVVHIAVHQEALGKGQDQLVMKHIKIHEMKLGVGPDESAMQGKGHIVQAQQPQPQPQPQPQQPQPAPQGMPPMGQPQQPQPMPGM